MPSKRATRLKQLVELRRISHWCSKSIEQGELAKAEIYAGYLVTLAKDLAKDLEDK